MPKLTFLMTAIGSPTFDESAPTATLYEDGMSIPVMSQVRLLGADKYLRFYTGPLGGWLSTGVKQGSYYPLQLSYTGTLLDNEYSLADSIEGMPFKTQLLTVQLPASFQFNINDYDRIEYREVLANVTGGYVIGHFTGLALWFYLDDQLVCDSGSAVVTGTSEQASSSGPYPVRDMRIDLFAKVAPDIFWTRRTRCEEQREPRTTLRRTPGLLVAPGKPPIPPTPGYWLEVADPPPPPAVQKFFSLGQTGGLPGNYRIEQIQGTGQDSDGGSSSSNGSGAVLAVYLPDGTKQVIRV